MFFLAGYSNTSKAYRVYNMRSQTVMETINIVVENFCDFSKFSKEDAISSLIDEAGVEVARDQSVATPSNTKTGPSESVATTNKPETDSIKQVTTEDYQKVDSRNSNEISSDVLTDPIRKEPLSWVNKNHPSYLIIGDPNDGMIIKK